MEVKVPDKLTYLKIFDIERETLNEDEKYSNVKAKFFSVDSKTDELDSN